ncbi:MAG: DUF3597 domain-containing protein [Luteolibacter sp.]
MGLFSGIMNKIFGHAPATTAQAATPAAAPAAAPAPAIPVVSTPAPANTTGAAPVETAPPFAAIVVVDVAAVLDDLAKHNAEKLDWKKSIVDLMKLVGMDSSLASRKELAEDLGYTGDMHDSGTMNVWLHREVIKKLAANGGKVPADLLG